MKYFSLIALFSSLSFFVFAQNTEGEILYETKVNVHRGLPPEMEAMKERIPEFRTRHNKLIFNASGAVVKHHKVEKKEQDFDQQQRRRRRRFGGDRSKDVTFISFENDQVVQSKNLFGKQFLIDGTKEKQQWKITGEQKQVGSYLCQKATLVDTVAVEVWFTPMIPVSIGPSGYSGLPGAILHLDENEGERVVTATEINMEPVESSVIVKPTEGKAISQEDFNELRKEKMEEMKQERAARGRRFRGR